MILVDPSSEATEPLDRAAERLRGAQLTSLTHELRAPVELLLECCELVVKDARDLEHAVALDYFEKMLEAALKLHRLVGEALDPANFHGDRLALQRRLRHELRGPLNPLRGYCELLLEDAGEQFLERFVPDVRKIYELAEVVLNRLEDLLAFVGAPLGTLPATLTPTDIVLPPPFDARPATPLERGRILVVDDNEHNRDLLVRRLTRDGHEVIAAPSGQAALETLNQQPFDLVLLDIMMPEVNGFEVLESIKTHPELAHLPVIMVSALNEIDSAV
jgi:CheY-like chemotaxis protein